MTDLIKREDALKNCILREDNPPTEMQLSLRNAISALPAVDPAAIREAAWVELAQIIRKWRNDVPMSGEECANAILALIGETE